MRKLLLSRMMLLLCALVAGSGSVWADTLTEGFEKATTSTTYNSTVNVSEDKSDCGIGWSIYYGTVSTNDKISGSNSAQMRWYSTATSNIPYAKTTTAIDGLTNVSLNARTSNLDVKMDVCYSADGSSWTVGKTHTFSKTGTGESVSLDIPTGNKFVKFEVSSSSTKPGSGNYKLIVDDVVFTYEEASSLETATWTVAPSSATVSQGESTTLQLTTNYDGTLAFASNNESVATVSYNASTKVITVTGVAAGTTSIKATGDATSTYRAISKSIDVTVNHPELASNFTDVMGPLGYTFFGLTRKDSSNDYAQPEVTSQDKTDNYGVTVSFAKADGGTYPRFDPAYTRFYKDNTLTVTAPTGSYITKIVFTEPSSNKDWKGSMTTETGDYINSEKTWYATETGVTSLVLTETTGTNRIGGIEVYLMVSPLSKTVTSAGWATFAPEYPVSFGSEEAYIINTASESSTTLTEVSSVPAGTPVLLKGAGEHTLTVVASSSTDVSSNCLKVSDGTITKDDGVYVLANGKYGVGFYLWVGDDALSEGKVYMQIPGGGSRAFFSLDGVTSVSEELRVKSEEFATAPVYDLQGRRVNSQFAIHNSQLKKGLYIVNGKKVIK